MRVFGTLVEEIVGQGVGYFDFIGDLIEGFIDWEVGGFFVGLIVSIGFLDILREVVMIDVVVLSVADVLVVAGVAGVAFVLRGHWMWEVRNERL